MPSDVLNNADHVQMPTLDQRVAALENASQSPASAVQAPLPDGFEQAVALINTYGPMLEELAAVGDKARAQGHTWTSIMASVGQQLLGIFLHQG